MTILKKAIASCKDVNGTVAVITAILAPIFMGGLAIGIDAAYWRYRTAQLQVAADVAALSVALDLKNSITSVITLTMNATNEAKKNGCSTSCSVKITYPYMANTNNILVVTSDASASRFFSFLYDNTQKTLSGRAVSTFASTNSIVSGSACVLGLAPYENESYVTVGMIGITIPAAANCEIFSNSRGNQNTTYGVGYGLYFGSNSNINVDGTVVGPIRVDSTSTMPASKQHPMYPSTITDPYASTIAASGILNLSQFTTPSVQTQCIETVVGGVPTKLDFSKSLATQMFSPSLRGYSFSLVSGISTHTISGGGGAFCADFTLIDNQKIVFGPGIWYFLKNFVTTPNSIIDATSTTSTMLNAGITNGAAATVDGTTLAVYPYGWTPLSSTNTVLPGFFGIMTVKAPTKGPTAGIAISQITSTAFVTMSGQATQWHVGQMTPVLLSANIKFRGAWYAPDYAITIYGSTVGAIPGSDGLATSGCSQFVMLKTSWEASTMNLGNACANTGAKAFGTIPNTGWQTTTTTTPGNLRLLE